MMLNFIDRVGEWNPQLFRELKGRLKPLNVLLAVTSSLLLQFVVFLYQLGQYPGEKYSIKGTYCFLSSNLYTRFCPPDEINFQMWWRDHWEYIFLAFSVIFIFTLLVAGTYLLISDLGKEENKGTLNFIRLSPQTETSILTGKMLGVPSLVYLFVLTAIPLHFWAGHSANIPSSYILGFYAILASCCGFFYSAALLCGLVNRSFSSFQPWLGSGAVLFLLFMTMFIADSSYNNNFNTYFAWLRLFSPWDITNYLFPNLFKIQKGSPLHDLQFFYLPIGKNVASLIGFYLINYAVAAYGLWQVIRRCFRNPETTILSKKQSYIFMAFAQVMFLGLIMQKIGARSYENIIFLPLINAGLIFSLIFVLSPIRPNIQDWARYRHQNHPKQPVWKDLLLGEKSPAILSVGVNLIIATTSLIILVVVFSKDLPLNNGEQGKALLALAVSVAVMLIYASIAQLMLLMKNPNRYLWAVGTVGAVISLPPIILSVLKIYPNENPAVWLFSTFPWAAKGDVAISTMFMALCFDVIVVALLNWRFNKQVKVLGESATKALLASR